MQRVIADSSSRILYGLAIVALPAAYYALYFNSGFNFSDDGNYAQICYELLLGRDPNDLAVGYGILWFKIGETLFRIFGVNYILIKLLFFFCIAVTNVLIYYTVALATCSRPFALLAAIVPALAPAFPATSFYALCIMLNVAAQMRLAHDLSQPWHAALAGAALSFSFQIRPDFGYVFVVPLIIVIALVSYTAAQRSTEASVHHYWQTLGLAALAGFTTVQMLGFIAAIAGGYGSVFLQQFMDYPAIMAGYFVDGMYQLVAGPVSPAVYASGLLQRPSIAEIFSGDSQIAQLTLLIYLPAIILLAFAFLNALLVFRPRYGHQVDALAPTVVALSATVAALPHYFFYRPDMSHIANFMPGYIVLVAVFAGQLYRCIRDRAPISTRFAAAFAVLALTLNLGVYLWVGLQSPGTGSIAIATGRTENFSAGNGVDVLATPSEKSELEFLRELIARNSEQSETIVCLPYCPGIAFMSERQMLLPNFYVDDTFLVNEPNWLSGAINLTREARPAVVIVIDWAINGTEQSRFTKWAAPYVAAVDELSHNKVVHGSITAYLL